MCGIAGFLDASVASPAAEATARVEAMCRAIAHRGPDDSGTYVEAAAGLGLGHRRLSIVDLSPLGHQPMTSADGRYVIVFNGEVYNFPELRAELEALGHRFRGGSDTEVMLAALQSPGASRRRSTRFVGMFAIALWDGRERTLYLVRDRIGVKPLYWCRQRGVLLFGSELKALRRIPPGRPRSTASAAAFVRFSYVPAPRPSSATCTSSRRRASSRSTGGRDAAHRALLVAARRGRGGRRPRRRISEEEAAETLEALLRDAVRGRMIADVPLGAFLSGGIDSSTVVALMQAQSNRPVRTFSIGFREPGYDEAQHAEAVAAPSRHRPHRALRHAARSDRRRPAPARMVRRAVRRLLADPDLSRVGDDAQARHRRAVRRRRRRTVRRLSALSHHREDVALARRLAPRSAARRGRRRARQAAGAAARSACSRSRPRACARSMPAARSAGSRRCSAEPSVDGLAVELAAIWAHERRLVPAAKAAYRLRTDRASSPRWCRIRCRGCSITTR